MQRQPRDGDWDDFSLDDYITEDIEPVNISRGYRDIVVPNSAVTMHNIFENWITDSLYLTQEGGTEHGFQVDAYGNVYGLYGGQERRIKFPADHPDNVLLNFHTHAIDTSTKYDDDFLIPLFSKPDIEDSVPLGIEDNKLNSLSDVGSTTIAITNAAVNPPEVKHAIITLSKASPQKKPYKPTFLRFQQMGQEIKSELAEGTNLKEVITDSAIFDTDVNGHIQNIVQMLRDSEFDYELTYEIVEDDSVISEENNPQ